MELAYMEISQFLFDLRYNASNLTIRHESGEWLYSEIVFASIELLTIEDYPLVNIQILFCELNSSKLALNSSRFSCFPLWKPQAHIPQSYAD
jgi:hypothetical protein